VIGVWRAAALLGAALVLAGAGPDDADLRGSMAEALYLESAAGDYAGALAIYRRLADPLATTVPRELAAEACLRAGIAHEVLGDGSEAEDVYNHAVDRFAGTPWADEARERLRSLERDRRRVRSLPAEHGFEDDVGALVHDRQPGSQGRIAHQRTDRGGELNGVVAWHTWVVSGREDALLVGFEDGVQPAGRVELDVLSRSFPLQLVLVLESSDGTRFETQAVVIAPGDGWSTLRFEPDDFREAGGAPYRATATDRLRLVDRTGLGSTDRGENLVLIDRFSVE